MSENKSKTKWFELSDLIPVNGLKGIERVQSSRNQYEGIDFELQIRKEAAYVFTSAMYHIVLPAKGAIALAQHYEIPQKIQTLMENYL